MKKLLYFFWLFLFSVSLLAQKDSSLIIFEHANVIDGIAASPLMNVTVTIDKGKITNIQKQTSRLIDNAIVIDLAGKWLLPGYIDAHVHFFSVESARKALQSGVTTARTMQCDHFIDISIRDAHHQQQADLPDIVAAGYQIRPDMPEAFYQDFPQLNDLKPSLSGVENVRRVVRALVTRKVNHIKVLATERAGTPSTDPRKRTFSDEELAAIVDEARKAGLSVAAHAHGDEGGSAAVLAGVRSIEHGTYLTDNTLRLMKSHGTYFVSNIAPDSAYARADTGLPIENQNNPILSERKRIMRPLAKEVTLRAYKMGIPVVGATDGFYSSAIGLKVTENAAGLVEIGIPPMEAIKAITSGAAKCVQVDKHTGAIKKGLDADMVIIGQNPLKNIISLQDIQMVMNDGKIAIINMK